MERQHSDSQLSSGCGKALARGKLVSPPLETFVRYQKDGQQTIAVPFVDVVLRAAKHANIYKPTSASGTTKFCKIQQS